MIRRLTIVFIVLSASHTLAAQDYPRKEVDLEILADQLFGFQDLDLNYQELYENMALLLSNPVNVNKASAEELRFLNLLSEYQVQNLILYRQENGEFLSVYELQSVPGFDLSVIYKIIPFITVSETARNDSFWKRVRTEENNYLILRYERTLETKAGFKESASPATQFRGNEDELYLRFRTSRPGDFSIGFTLDKDAGEEIVWNATQRQYGFDFNSFHVQLMNKGKLKNLIIGDYQTQFGQGLQLGGSFGYGKGSETVLTTRRSNLGFLPYTSVNEAGNKKGVAITYELSRSLFLSAFYSNAWRDATLANDSSEEVTAYSFQTTGLHRNENELNNRQQIHEQNYGAILNYKQKSIDGGIIVNLLDYNIPVNRNPQPYNQFAFNGRSSYNVGAFLNYTLHNFTFFSEVAKTLEQGTGVTAGILGSVTPKLDVTLNFRNYARNFESLYANAFAESSLPQNESGLYWGWKYSWNKKFSASGYADLFHFPWLRYRSYAPSEGYEWLFRFNYQPSRHVVFFVQAREESKVRNLSSEQGNTYQTGEGIKRNYWINCDYGVTDKIKLKTRAQFSTFDFGGISTKGMTLLQDISIDLGRLTLTGRYALFDTDDYDNRQYVYEREVWLAYALPAYSGVGIRNYILAEYSVSKQVSVWVRFAHTRFTDRNEIGSGADTIEGSTRNDLRLQARIKF